MLRTPSMMPVWLPAALLLGAFAGSTYLVTKGYDTAALVLVGVVALLLVTLTVIDPFVTKRRSRELRATLSPADVAARVEPRQVAAVWTSGHRKAQRRAARLVQRSYPRLRPDDALLVTRDLVRSQGVHQP